MHQTKPQTLGYSLADSPVGLLAWMYEKMVSWSDEYEWSDDEGTPAVYADLVTLVADPVSVLTWVSIYWFSSAGPAASVRIYYEASQAFNLLGSYVSKVPMGISVFPKDLGIVPRRYELLTFLSTMFSYLEYCDTAGCVLLGKSSSC